MVSLITHSRRAVGVRGFLKTGRVCLNSHNAIEKASVCWFSNRRTRAVHSILSAFFQARFVGWPAKVDHSLITDVPREKDVGRCKERAFNYLEKGDLKSAVTSFVGNINSRSDCQLPHRLAALGGVVCC